MSHKIRFRKVDRNVVLLTVIIVSLSASICLAQVRVKPESMKDSRTTGSFFAGFEIELSVAGESLKGAKSMRVLLDTAVDETGRNIIREQRTDFENIDEDQTETKVTIKMKNPSRSAMTLKEIAGSVELFVPARDPAATVTVTSLAKSIGVPVRAPALKASGIEITIWNKQQYEARKKAEEEKMKKSRAERSEAGVGEALTEAMTGIFGGLLGGLDQMDENNIAFQVKDPQLKLVRIEIQDGKGEVIGSGGMTIGDSKQQTRIYDLQEKLPPDARVKIYVLTAKSMVKTPFRLEKVLLP